MANESTKTRIALAILLIAAFIVIGTHLTASSNHMVHMIAAPLAGLLAAIGWFFLGGFRGLWRTPEHIYADIKEGRQQRMTSLQRASALLAMVIMIVSSITYW